MVLARKGKIIKLGNSLGIIISRDMLEQLNLSKGVEIIITSKEGKITIEKMQEK